MKERINNEVCPICYNENRKRWKGILSIGRNTNGIIMKKFFYGSTKADVKEKMNMYFSELYKKTLEQE